MELQLHFLICLHGVVLNELRIWTTFIFNSSIKHTHVVIFNLLKPSGSTCTTCLKHNKTLHSAHTLYLCVPYGSHNKQRLFP
jgi:hypothetical protein